MEISRGNPEVLGFPCGNQSFLKIYAVAPRITQFILHDPLTQKTFGNVNLVMITFIIRVFNIFTKSHCIKSSYFPKT